VIKAGITIWLVPDVEGTWFVYHGDLEENVRKAAEMGYAALECRAYPTADEAAQSMM